MKRSILFLISLLVAAINVQSCSLLMNAANQTSEEVDLSEMEEQILPEVKSLLDKSIQEYRTMELPQRIPSREKKYNLLHTILDLRIDWKKEWLIGRAELKFCPYFHDVDTLVLDAVGLEIKSVKVVDLYYSDELPFTYNERELSVSLQKKLSRYDTMTVSIEYIAKPGELFDKGLILNKNATGLHFVNSDGKEEGRAKQVWTQNQTQSASCWFPTIDAPNHRFSQEVYLTVKDGLTAVSNGEFVYKMMNPDSTWTFYYRQNIPHPAYLTAFAAGDFYKYTTSWNNKPVEYYLPSPQKEHGELIFGRTPEMLAFFSDCFGVEYPWEKYAQVVVNDFVSGAMENTSCSIFGDFVVTDERGLIDNNPDDIIAHELSHHWFGDYVTCESWSNLTLNEAFGTYAEYLWNDYKYGRDQADYILSTFYDYYLFESTYKNVSLIRPFYSNADSELFDNHTYSKGALVLDVLRREVGDSVFFRSLTHYLNENAGKSVELADLRQAFEYVSGKDLTWFFEQWFEGYGYPVVSYNWQYSDSIDELTVNTFQIQKPSYSLFDFPIEVKIYEGEGDISHSIRVNKMEQEFKIPLSVRPKEVLLFADKVCLAKVVPDTNISDPSVFYSENSALPYKDFLLDMALGKKDSVYTDLFVKACRDSHWSIRLKGLKYFGESMVMQDSIARSVALQQAESLLNDSRSEVRAEALQLSGRLNSIDLQRLVKIAENDSSYRVVYEAFKVILLNFPEQSTKILQGFESTDNPNIQLFLGMIYTVTTENDHTDFFKKSISFLQGDLKITQIDNYAYYLRDLDDAARIDGFNFMEDSVLGSRDWRIRKKAYNSMQEITYLFIDESVDGGAEYLEMNQRLKLIRSSEKDERVWK